jgi:hypothetical protein
MSQEPEAIDKIAFSSHIRSNKDIVSWPEFYIDIM